MIEIYHYFRNNKEIYTAIYLDELLLVDWTVLNSGVKISEVHPAIKEAKHYNKFLED